MTWYSKLLAVILFVLVFYVGFLLGKDTVSVPFEREFSQPSTVQPINTVSYTCAGGKVIIAKYYQNESIPVAKSGQPPIPGGSVSLTLGDGRSMTLLQTISADGTRYADTDESFIFWSKGNTAFIAENDLTNKTYNGYNNCVALSQNKTN